MSSSNFFDIVILLGALQGFISAALLYRSKKNVITNRLMALTIFFIALACMNMYLFLTLEISGSMLLLVLESLIPMIIVMPLGPLLFFYSRYILESDFKFRKKDRYHFASVLLDIIPNLLALGYFAGKLVGITNPSQLLSLNNFSDLYDQYVDIPRWISLSIYLLLSVRILRLNHPAQKTRKWAVQLLTGFTIFQLVWLTHLIPYVLPSLSDGLLSFVGWYPVYIPLTILVYWLGINGLIIHQNNLNSSTAFPKSEVDEVVRLLNEVISKDRLYMNSGLKLNHVVVHTGIPAKKISHVLNQHQGRSFNEFVNEFRVQEVKSRMKDPEYQHFTITGIALDCGFNSQATFHRTFKSITGKTPREFRNSYSGKN